MWHDHDIWVWISFHFVDQQMENFFQCQENEKIDIQWILSYPLNQENKRIYFPINFKWTVPWWISIIIIIVISWLQTFIWILQCNYENVTFFQVIRNDYQSFLQSTNYSFKIFDSSFKSWSKDSIHHVYWSCWICLKFPSTFLQNDCLFLSS